MFLLHLGEERWWVIPEQSWRSSLEGNVGPWAERNTLVPQTEGTLGPPAPCCAGRMTILLELIPESEESWDLWGLCSGPPGLMTYPALWSNGQVNVNLGLVKPRADQPWVGLSQDKEQPASLQPRSPSEAMSPSAVAAPGQWAKGRGGEAAHRRACWRAWLWAGDFCQRAV